MCRGSETKGSSKEKKANQKKKFLTNISKKEESRFTTDQVQQLATATYSEILDFCLKCSYPLIGLQSKGDDPDPWLAKVLTMQERSRTVRVLYYRKDEDRPGQELFIPYCNTRHAHDSVSWDCILNSAYGEWKEEAFELLI